MDASSAVDRSPLSLLSTLFIARYSRELPRFRVADGIVSMLVGGISMEGVVEGGVSKGCGCTNSSL